MSTRLQLSTAVVLSSTGSEKSFRPRKEEEGILFFFTKFWASHIHKQAYADCF